jgi:SAM-dependent methyltransferase
VVGRFLGCRRPMVTKDDVVWCYRNLLGRDPESSEMVESHLGDFGDVRELLKSFVECDEYKLARSATSAPAGPVSLGALDGLPANPIDLDLTPAQRNTLWEHVGNVWGRLGATDPYWSVLSTEELRLANMTEVDRIDGFYESGRSDLDRVEKYLVRHGRRLPERGTCVDYGCGLGRTTLWLARRCERVLALDVSQAHLSLARERFAAAGASNVACHLVRRAEDLAHLRGIEFFYSVIVLQHNPPPLIAEILSAVFNGLNPGGCAFFQVPTYAVNYHWRYDDYLPEAVAVGDMEMHVLPQETIFDLAAKSGCVPLEVQPDSWTGLADGISNTFLFAKPATA